ncbi:gfo/Idh/MocA family oxidoreductase [Paenibacillus cremeus]|uniref:Gfo/Idh/MocA family oxidoreductase n=2 Tax=Paenibacillus cremeus TaxID=2163881 RepID=A0A559K8Y6_9BACL|nr:gfo/Idh/MocA family oxidoreductase [Paenibacillus cremeus]
MIGLDTSHVSHFTKVLNSPEHENHIPGGRIVTAYRGVPSADFEASYSRIDRFSSELQSEYGVELVGSAEEVAERSDAIFLMSVDGRVHRELFRRIAPYGKPVFIDKPLAVDSRSARDIAQLAERYGVKWMSCSSRRFSASFTEELERTGEGDIIGADMYGPMPLEPTQPGLFWYGIHIVDMLYRALGQGCTHVTATTGDDHDLVVGVWKDGRIGTIRGNRMGNKTAGGLLHRTASTRFVDVERSSTRAYAAAVGQAMQMFTTGVVPINPAETLEIVRFIEAANESRATGGKTVVL